MHSRIALALLVAVSAPAASQQLVGYSPANAAKEKALEASAIKRPAPSEAATLSRDLSKETHVAGTPAQARTRDYVINAENGNDGASKTESADPVWLDAASSRSAGSRRCLAVELRDAEWAAS